MDAQNLKFHRKTQFFSLQTCVTYSIIIALQDISNTPKPEAYIWISMLIRVNTRINLVLANAKHLRRLEFRQAMEIGLCYENGKGVRL